MRLSFLPSFTSGKKCLELRELTVLMPLGHLPMKIVTVVCVSCWGVLWVYVFPCGLGSYRYHIKIIKYIYIYIYIYI